MKYMKIVVKKEVAHGGFKFVYPEGYDALKINVTGYEHNADTEKQSETEFMLGIASDDFVESSDMESIDKSAYISELSNIMPTAV